MNNIPFTTHDFLLYAVLLLLEREKTLVEGAGATPVAALLSGKIPEITNVHSSSHRICLILSGGNMDVSTGM